MRQVKRWRYYCDHCKKVSGRKDVMVRHESGCTNNPDRVCGFCRISENEQEHINTLKAALFTDINNFQKKTIDPYVRNKIEIKNLRAVSNNCPACILAAIKQIEKEGHFWEFDFDFKEEMSGFWAEYNRHLQQDVYYG
ncbi:MAG TPA: hypothetical protein DCR95_11520 [Desulfobacter sp.]|nr:hypothetical protein [Desulfobacter sp.]